MVTEKNTKQELMDEYKKLSVIAKEKKAKIPASAKSINSKSTKADILNVINELEQAINAAETVVEEFVKKQPVETETVQEQPKKKMIFTTSESAVKKEDNELNYLKQEIRDEINALETAKSLKKQEYTELLQIEQELVKFVNMINQNKNKNIADEEIRAVKKAEQEKTAEEDTKKCEEQNKEKLDNANESLEQTVADIAAKKETLAAERAVETEQYDYDIAKKQKTEDDLWADESAKREEALEQVKADTEKLKADIESKESLVAELKTKIDEIPALVENAKQEGAEAKSKELGKEHGYKQNKAKKEAEVAAQSLKKQIERLKADYDAVVAEKDAIQAKLDKAYEESNKLYMATVQSTGGVKILSSGEKN